MPELPEVETIKRGLSDKIIGKKIIDINIETKKSFQGNPKDVIGAKIIAIKRRAKLIRVKLSNNLNLLFHLKLTGQLIYKPSLNLLLDKEETLSGGTRLIFTFNNNSKLFFNDLRKFGWCRVLDNIAVTEFLGNVGVEPFSKDFTVEYLLLKAKKIPNRKIKQFLTDQTIIAGIGNIYADESLFDAGIMPTRKLKDVKLSEWKKLRASILQVLKLGLKYGGASENTYVNAEGKQGEMHKHFKVYRRTGQPCLGNCDGVVKRMTIAGRGTHYCPKCQK